MISILLPTYNSALFLRDAIDSVLAQSYRDWELVVVDDASVDSTTSVVFSYADPRIKYYYKEHGGVADTLNFGLSRCSGDYVARMDADDIMMPDRLRIQLAYMNNNPDVGVLGSGMEFFGGDRPHVFSLSGRVTKEQMLKGCCIAHPTVMFRGDLARNITYPLDAPHAEDYHLWLTLLDHDVLIVNIPDVVLRYRQHPGQMSSLYSAIQQDSSRRAVLSFQSRDTIDSDLTVIIPFRNEGDEIEKTVMSVRDTAYCKIVLVDDASDDDFDYRSVADRYGCLYHRNPISLGTGGARNIGVHLCDTAYFVQIDGHMRFYNTDWHNDLLTLLKANPKSLVCANSIGFKRNENGDYENEDGASGRDSSKTQGALINLSEPGWELTARWNYQPTTDAPYVEIPCVMGGFYASSKKWWTHIRGLHGSIGYGADEPLMSVKTWLAGGTVLLISKWGVGHLYRDKHPYPALLWKDVHNSLLTILLLCPDRSVTYFDHYRKRVGDSIFERAMAEIELNRSAIEAHRKFLWSNVFVRSFEEFEAFNSMYCNSDES